MLSTRDFMFTANIISCHEEQLKCFWYFLRVLVAGVQIQNRTLLNWIVKQIVGGQGVFLVQKSPKLWRRVLRWTLIWQTATEGTKLFISQQIHKCPIQTHKLANKWNTFNQECLVNRWMIFSLYQHQKRATFLHQNQIEFRIHINWSSDKLCGTWSFSVGPLVLFHPAIQG